MNPKIIVTLLCGMLAGSIVTLVATHSFGSARETVQTVTDDHHSDSEPASSTENADPFAEAGVTSEAAEGTRDPFDRPLNMQDRFERDVCISFWYLNMQVVVSTLERQTGHKFKPVAKMSAGPVEILEEQAKFMKEFLADSEKTHFNPPKIETEEQNKQRLGNPH